MKKIEMIWREILETSTNVSIFQQQTLAKKFNFSTSTVFAALKPLRDIGAVAVTGRNFRLTNFEKVLLYWATHRNLTKDIIYQTHVDQPILEIEGLVDNQSIYGAFSAVRILLGSAPADYDKVYVYGSKNLKIRFPKLPGPVNFIVLKPDLFLTSKITPVSQTFVDLWNVPDWYATDFLNALKEKYYGHDQ